jgi:mannose-6-phosphate isomerase-like protein (cupin superfamily)
VIGVAARDRVGARQPTVVRPEGGEQLPFIGTLRASDVETDGGFEVIEYVGPATPPPHVHKDHDEAFWILEGTFSFILGHETVEAPKGALVLVPRGTRHGFSVAPGSRALLFTIPAGLAGFFRELGAGLAAGKPDAEIRAALAGKYDSHPALG